MDSSSKLIDVRGWAARLRILIWMGALTLAVLSLASRARAGSEPAASQAGQTLESGELVKEIEVGLIRIVPSDMRIDGVTLGCKPPLGATLKTVAPGISNLMSRSFMVELQVGDHSMFCSAAMDASRELLTATRDLEADAPVTDADFSPTWVEAFSIAPGALARFPDTGPYVSAMPIRAGQPLYQNSLKRPIAVRPGDLVTVLVHNGPVTVRAQLQSQSQAAVGDNATMINPGSGLPVAVTVTGPKTAELVMQ